MEQIVNWLRTHAAFLWGWFTTLWIVPLGIYAVLIFAGIPQKVPGWVGTILVIEMVLGIAFGALALYEDTKHDR